MEREYKIDNLRAIAILLVVLGHSIIIYDPNWGLISSNVKCLPFMYLKKVINLVQMPLFFSLSGFCFCLSKNQIFNSEMLTNKFMRILLPYFFICFLYMDPIKIGLGVPGYDFSLEMLLQQLVLFIDNGHLWYLPTLFLMFIVSSLVLRGGKSISTMMLLAIILSVLSSRVFAWFCLSQFCLYYVYFLLGYVICRNKKIVNKSRTVGIGLCLVPITLSLWLNDGGLLKHSLLILMSFSVVIGLYCLVSSSRNKFLMILSKNSYGIYLFHSPLIYFMYMLYPNASPMVMFTMNFIVCGIISLGLVSVVRILGLKFIIGEK